MASESRARCCALVGKGGLRGTFEEVTIGGWMDVEPATGLRDLLGREKDCDELEGVVGGSGSKRLSRPLCPPSTYSIFPRS